MVGKMISIARELIGPVMTIEDIVLDVMLPCSQPAADLVDSIQLDFGISVSIKRVEDACRRLEADGRIVRDNQMPGVEWKLAKRRRAR